MSYSTENAKDNVSRNMLAILSPKIRLTSWTLYSGSVYSIAFPFGYVTSVSRNGSAYTLGTSASLSAGQYYYDLTNQILYIRKADSTAPSGSDWIVAIFELYLATNEVYWYRNPTDTTTDTVQFKGLISNPPTFSRSYSDQLFGFAPSQQTDIGCIFEPEYFQEMLYGASFSGATVVVYHVAGRLTIGNLSKLFSGLCGSPTVSDLEISFPLIDKNFLFEAGIKNGSYSLYFDVSGTTRDPSMDAKPIRQVYGYKTMRAWPTDYIAVSPATTDNRHWAVCSLAQTSPALAATITSAPTIFDAIISRANGIAITDLAGDGVGYPVVVTGGSLGPTIIVTTATGIGYNATEGQVVLAVGQSDPGRILNFSRFFSVTLIQGGISYPLKYGRDYFDGAGSDWATVDLFTSAEANAGASTIDPSNGDYLIVEAFGPDLSTYQWNSQDILTAPASGPVANVHPTNPAVILFYILKNFSGLTDAQIDGASFQTVAAAMDKTVHFAIPETENDGFPTLKEIITKLLNSMLCHAYFDADGIFTLVQIGVAGVSQSTIEDSDIAGDVKFDFNFDDVARLRSFGPQKEYEAFSGDGKALFQRKVYEENYAGNLYVHGSSRVLELEQYLQDGEDTASPDARADWMDQVVEIIGERKGRLSLTAKSGLHALDLGDTVTIYRDKLPGFAYAQGTNRTRDFVIIEIRKDIDQVEVVLDDQKGIQDNTGDW